MIAHGVHTHEKVLADLPIGEPLRHELKHLQLALAQGLGQDRLPKDAAPSAGGRQGAKSAEQLVHVGSGCFRRIAELLQQRGQGRAEIDEGAQVALGLGPAEGGDQIIEGGGQLPQRGAAERPPEPAVERGARLSPGFGGGEERARAARRLVIASLVVSQPDPGQLHRLQSGESAGGLSQSAGCGPDLPSRETQLHATGQHRRRHPGRRAVAEQGLRLVQPLLCRFELAPGCVPTGEMRERGRHGGVVPAQPGEPQPPGEQRVRGFQVVALVVQHTLRAVETAQRGQVSRALAECLHLPRADLRGVAQTPLTQRQHDEIGGSQQHRGRHPRCAAEGESRFVGGDGPVRIAGVVVGRGQAEARQSPGGEVPFLRQGDGFRGETPGMVRLSLQRSANGLQSAHLPDAEGGMGRLRRLLQGALGVFQVAQRPPILPA